MRKLVMLALLSLATTAVAQWGWNSATLVARHNSGVLLAECRVVIGEDREVSTCVEMEAVNAAMARAGVDSALAEVEVVDSAWPNYWREFDDLTSRFAEVRLLDEAFVVYITLHPAPAGFVVSITEIGD